MSEDVVPWTEGIQYCKECREQAFVALSAADEDRDVWRAQGKIALLDELLNLKDVFATMSEIDKPAQTAVSSDKKRVWLTRSGYETKG